MDMRDNENHLVPGQGQPLNLDKLKKLAASGQPLAGGQAAPGTAAAKPRHFKRAGQAWAGALALGAVLASAGALVLGGKGGVLEALAGGTRPAMPDVGMSQAEAERYWAMAAFEPSRFPALLGVPVDDLKRQEENARKLQRLLSEQEHPGLN